MKSVLTNEHGQAMTAALIILPLALVLFCGAIVLMGALALEAKATAACRVSLADSQGQAALKLAQLLALNDTAERFEQRRRLAQLALKAAIVSGNPAAMSAARTSLAIIETMQKPVALKQKALLMAGKKISLQAALRANEAIRSSLPPAIQDTRLGFLKVARFDVVAFPADARTPTYRPAQGFNRSQEAKARWLLQVPTGKMSTAESPTVSEASTSIEIGCAMTLEKTRGEKWEPKMTEDKLLRN